MMGDMVLPDEKSVQASIRRLRVEVQGVVQGVGFRPFVYRLATELGLTGWVINDSRGVFVEVEGSQPLLDRFLDRLPQKNRSTPGSFPGYYLAARHGYRALRDPPQRSTRAPRRSSSCPTSPPAPTAWPRSSTRPIGATATRSPTAPTAARASPSSRPCPTTGPTRPCAVSTCARPASAEYDDPLDRRFHAQPNACPVCGPQLASARAAVCGCRSTIKLDAGRWQRIGRCSAMHARLPWRPAAGQIVAVKGLGGFHLMVDAAQRTARRPPARAQAAARQALRPHGARPGAGAPVVRSL